MKKIFLALILTAAFYSVSFAGDLGDILGVDMAMGIVGGAAMGVAFSTPSYMDGGSTADPRVFLVGAGWGALGGAIAGLAYGVYGIVDHINMRNKSTIKTSMENGDVIIAYNPVIQGIVLTKKF